MNKNDFSSLCSLNMSIPLVAISIMLKEDKETGYDLKNVEDGI